MAVAVIGLGYVGLSISVLLSENFLSTPWI